MKKKTLITCYLWGNTYNLNKNRPAKLKKKISKLIRKHFVYTYLTFWYCYDKVPTNQPFLEVVPSQINA